MGHVCETRHGESDRGSTGMDLPMVLVRTHVYTRTPYIFTHTHTHDRLWEGTFFFGGLLLTDISDVHSVRMSVHALDAGRLT